MSNGEMMDKKKIDRRVAQAKEQYLQAYIDEHGYLFCERTKRSDLPLERSHIASVKMCQESKKSEIAWSLDNFEFLTREEHMKIEVMERRHRWIWYQMRIDGFSFDEFLKKIEECI